MKPYADLPARRTRQIALDLLFFGWLVWWVWVGTTVHDATLALAAPAERTERAASSLADHLRDGADRLGDVPLVGDEAAEPVRSAAGSADEIAAAGARGVQAVESLAWQLGLVVAAIPIVVVAAFFLPARVRFVRAASAGQRFVDADSDLDLFALRALANQPLPALARISDDPAGAWRAGDQGVVRQLATLELRSHGLHPPAPGRMRE